MILPFSSTALTITTPSLVVFLERTSDFFQEDSEVGIMLAYA